MMLSGQEQLLRSSVARTAACGLLIVAAFGAYLFSIRAYSEQSVAASEAHYEWFEPGYGGVLPAEAEYVNAVGKLGVVNTKGPINTAGHPFFEPIGTNDRACVTCHQPNNAMSISVESIRQRWEATSGKDPLFAPVDGSNCPSLPQGERSSHSLLLDRGLFRIALPWPPKNRDGSPITPEFTIEVANDPTGCNTDPVYGLESKTPRVSVFRRPRVAANLKYITRRGASINLKNGRAMDVDPDTGIPVTMNLMSDARHPTLKLQGADAAHAHLQSERLLDDESVRSIVGFLDQVFVAQSHFDGIGDLTANGTSEWLGPKAMAEGRVGALGDNLDRPVFGPLDQWKKDGSVSESVARGYRVFLMRPFWIRDAVYLNNIGLGNPVKRTCSTCHNNTMTGMDLAPGWMDIGVANEPWANDLPELPLFKLTCGEKYTPHPYLGRTVFTHDPGRALITGRCVDIGSITIQQFRGLAARAPYFSNGSARNLDEVVDFYDRRFDMRLTDQEKIDLRNFLGVL